MVTDGQVRRNPESKAGGPRPIDLNRAIARAIIAGRPYRSVEALRRVKGIGEKRLADLHRLVTVP